MGIKSLDYFYNDVFKNNYNLMMLYLFQDILSNYSYLHTNIALISELIKYNINKLIELKKIIFNKLFDRKVMNYYVKN
jgi:hypothetical protein